MIRSAGEAEQLLVKSGGSGLNWVQVPPTPQLWLWAGVWALGASVSLSVTGRQQQYPLLLWGRGEGSLG